jgi:endonuclease/exonuclease/phosphatase family metal-dependent hydrolase
MGRAGSVRRELRAALAGLLIASAVAGCAKAVNYPNVAEPISTWQSQQASRPADTDSFRVVSFNIAFAIEIDRAIEALQQSGPLQNADVIALQEMDAPGTERIARALHMNAVYFPSGVHPKHDRDFGCAILSPWPLVEPRKLILPHGARVSGLRRAATSAVVMHGTHPIRVYSLHLPAPMSISGGSRKHQLRVLAANADSAGMPVVIAGDFNSRGKVEELERAGYVWVTKDMAGSIPKRFLGIRMKSLRYDHILTRGLESAGPPGVVADNRGASDHLPIWAVFLIRANP